jgi:tRNA pseudouridine38-40 synthase
MEDQEILDYVNHYLPEDIGMLQICRVQPRFHARLNARGKTYVYRIWNSSLPNVFDRRWMYTVPEPLDVETMRQAASHFLGKHDFAAFCAVKNKKKSTVRTIFQISVERLGHEVQIKITGDGFLHHMVRIMAGTLVEVGLGKRSPAHVPLLLEQGVRADAGITMPAKGLILWQVYYETGDTGSE